MFCLDCSHFSSFTFDHCTSYSASFLLLDFVFILRQVQPVYVVYYRFILTYHLFLVYISVTNLCLFHISYDVNVHFQYGQCLPTVMPSYLLPAHTAGGVTPVALERNTNTLIRRHRPVPLSPPSCSSPIPAPSFAFIYFCILLLLKDRRHVLMACRNNNNNNYNK